MDREAQRHYFLAAQGWAEAKIEALPPDASFRRYFRLRQGEQRRMLMDAPPSHENISAFIDVAQHLQRLGLHPPRVDAVAIDQGFALLEDLGDDTFTRLLARGVDASELYPLAIDVLRYLHRHPQATDLPLPAYDTPRLLDEAVLLVDWYWPMVHGTAAPTQAREAYLSAWREILHGISAVPQTLVLRDFHVDNLMRVAGASTVQQCGLLDFQDAVLGPVAYDVVSLLEDARRDLDPELVTAMLARYLQDYSAAQRMEFMHGYTVLGAQRHCKVLGIFVRLYRRDGKNQYLAHLPRVWRLLKSHQHQPYLRPLRHWLEHYLPEYS